MLKIEIPGLQLYDEDKNEFLYTKGCTLLLEHSLLSVSKWEAIWHKPFLETKDKTEEESLSYIQCMTINSKVDPEVYKRLTLKNIEDIKAYIDDPMSATTINDRDQKKGALNKEIITSEIIYYWLISLQMNVEYFEKWHFNRLITLIRVCSIKNTPPKKMSKREILNRNRALNEANRKAYNSKG